MSLTATEAEVLQWLQTGIFRVIGQDIYKGDRKLSARINKRKGMDNGDPRVDLCYKGKRKSMHVSRLVWMDTTRVTTPDGFEIHHRDGNPRNNAFENLVCVHFLDHYKLHEKPESELEEAPF